MTWSSTIWRHIIWHDIGDVYAKRSRNTHFRRNDLPTTASLKYSRDHASMCRPVETIWKVELMDQKNDCIDACTPGHTCTCVHFRLRRDENRKTYHTGGRAWVWMEAAVCENRTSWRGRGLWKNDERKHEIGSDPFHTRTSVTFKNVYGISHTMWIHNLWWQRRSFSTCVGYLREKSEASIHRIGLFGCYDTTFKVWMSGFAKPRGRHSNFWPTSLHKFKDGKEPPGWKSRCIRGTTPGEKPA